MTWASAREGHGTDQSVLYTTINFLHARGSLSLVRPIGGDVVLRWLLVEGEATFACYGAIESETTQVASETVYLGYQANVQTGVDLELGKTWDLSACLGARFFDVYGNENLGTPEFVGSVTLGASF